MGQLLTVQTRSTVIPLKITTTSYKNSKEKFILPLLKNSLIGGSHGKTFELQ